MNEDDKVVLHRRSLEEQVEYLMLQVGLLTARLNQMENKRKGGRPSKKLLVKAEGVCGLDPERDSASCPDASLYRRRQGCGGEACRRISADYYKDRP
jgi:hypothetical protein